MRTVSYHLKNIILFTGLFFVLKTGMAQNCPKDSNYFSIRYFSDNNRVADAVVTYQNEMVSLCQFSTKPGFVTKFTSQGNMLWAKEFLPNYEHGNWYEYPWYTDVQWQ